MRGSPLFRTLLVLLALIVAALGIRALSQPAAPVAPPTPTPSSGPAEAVIQVPFFLTFSARPEHVRIESGGQIHELQPEGVTAAGTLELPGDHPVIFLTIDWAEGDAGTPRFAKLTLEPPGQPTLTRTFDGFGRIDDVWELHP